MLLDCVRFYVLSIYFVRDWVSEGAREWERVSVLGLTVCVYTVCVIESVVVFLAAI